MTSHIDNPEGSATPSEYMFGKKFLENWGEQQGQKHHVVAA